jgi:hypothetical protein
MKKINTTKIVHKQTTYYLTSAEMKKCKITRFEKVNNKKYLSSSSRPGTFLMSAEKKETTA